jgi:SAM-dependent methyltransferase
VVSQASVKTDLRLRYDGLGGEVLSRLERIRDPERLWRLVEGERPALRYFRMRKVETALALGRFTPGSRLLEVGCGTGDYSFLLARRGFRMRGIDLSPVSIEAARQKAAILGLPDIAFTVSDAEALSEIEDASVDGVISFSTLRYVPDPRQALRAIYRVLRPGGVAVVDFPNRYCPWFRWLKTRFGVEGHIHDHFYSTREVLGLLEAAGFPGLAARRILFTPYVLPAPLLPLFRAIDRVAERLPGANQTAGIIVARGAKA